MAVLPRPLLVDHVSLARSLVDCRNHFLGEGDDDGVVRDPLRVDNSLA